MFDNKRIGRRKLRPFALHASLSILSILADNLADILLPSLGHTQNLAHIPYLLQRVQGMGGNTEDNTDRVGRDKRMADRMACGNRTRGVSTRIPCLNQNREIRVGRPSIINLLVHLLSIAYAGYNGNVLRQIEIDK
ncbi:MAG: hypothetical protein UMV23_06685 [Halanaerobium sp.]|nr:hypothetical protein [Halanaerobium sp.]